jgi:hypothetical protein
MISMGRDFVSVAWWLATFPGLAILATVLAINLVGDRLRARSTRACADSSMDGQPARLRSQCRASPLHVGTEQPAALDRLRLADTIPADRANMRR